MQADCQMPHSMFFAMLSGRVIGTAEWQLRAINLLWGALALIGMNRVGRRIQMPWMQRRELCRQLRPENREGRHAAERGGVCVRVYR